MTDEMTKPNKVHKLLNEIKFIMVNVFYKFILMNLHSQYVQLKRVLNEIKFIMVNVFNKYIFMDSLIYNVVSFAI